MIIPVRCMSCGKVIADKWLRFKELAGEERGADAADADAADKASKLKTAHGRALDRLGLTRYCCRTHLLTHVDMLHSI